MTVAVRTVAGRGAVPRPRIAILATRRARILGLLVAALGLVMIVLASLAIGSVEIGLAQVIGAFVAGDDSDAQLIVRELRLPRTLVGIAVGVGLGLAGAVMQAVTRNPLAEPGILGVNAGASLAVVLAIAVLGIGDARGYVWFAFGGAALATIAVYALGSVGSPRAAPVRVALAGAVLAAVLGSLTTAVLLVDARTLDQFRFWIVGSIAGRDIGTLAVVMPFLVAGAAIALASGRALNALSLGDEIARSLGQRVAMVRTVATLAEVLLTGAVVAVAGPIGFVGLAAPHAARALAGADHRWVMAYAALLGACLVLFADIVGRVIARPGEVEVGIMTALLGAPLFIVLVRRPRLAEV
jgi:iron complex transport system permease protein